MSSPSLNAIMDFAVALGKENLPLSGAVIELPKRTWDALYREMRKQMPSDYRPTNGLAIATPNGDIRVRCQREPAATAAAKDGT